jgi:hypothetical protein
MVVADLNGDGKGDVIASGNKGLAVFYGNGDGTLQPCVTLASVPLPEIAAADFDHDGAIDVLGWTEDGALLFYRGTRTGLLPPVTLVKYLSRSAFAIADLNGDQRLDVIVQPAPPVAAHSEPALAIFLGQEGGGFSSQPPVFLPNGAAGDYASQLTVWDLDHDGHPDILAHMQSGTQVWKGDGNGGLHPIGSTQPVTAGTVADLDNDGYPDIVALSSGTVGIAYGSSAGWSTMTSINLVSAGRLLAEDVDGDSFPDLLLFNSGLFAVLHNRGDRTFDPPVAWFSNIEAAKAVSADLTGSGRRDLIFAGDMSGQTGLQVIAGLPGGRFDATPALLVYQETEFPFTARQPLQSFASDIDHDGDLDLIIVAAEVGSALDKPEILVFRNAGDGQFTPWQTIRITEGFVWLGATCGDFDGDGNLDIAFVPSFDPSKATQAVILFGNPDATFTRKQIELPAGTMAPQALDFFHTGRAQLALTLGEKMTLVSIARQGSVTSAVTWPGSPDRAGDVNGDGLLDIVGPVIVKNMGGGLGTSAPPQAGMSSVPMLGDVDGDGRADALTYVEISPGNAIATWRSRGDFTFAPPLYCGTDSAPVQITDCDGDGKADIVRLRDILISRGDGTYIADGALQEGRLTTIADLNGDGRPDAVAFVQNAVIPLLSHTTNIGTRPSSLSVTASTTHTQYAMAVRVEPHVTSDYGVPTGTITFREGARVYATALVGSSVSLPLGAGNHSIAAEYSGDARLAPSTATLNIQIDKITIPLQLGIVGNVASLPITLTASFRPLGNGTQFDFVPPAGTFTFYVGQKVLGVVSAASPASIVVQPAEPNGQFRVEYSGDDNRNPVSVAFGGLTRYDVAVSPSDSIFTVTPVDIGYDLDVELRAAGGGPLTIDPAKLPAVNFTASRGNFNFSPTEYRGNGHFGTVLHVSRAANEDIVITAAVGAVPIATRVIGPQGRRRSAGG